MQSICFTSNSVFFISFSKCVFPFYGYRLKTGVGVKTSLLLLRWGSCVDRPRTSLDYKMTFVMIRGKNNRISVCGRQYVFRHMHVPQVYPYAFEISPCGTVAPLQDSGLAAAVLNESRIPPCTFRTA